VEGPIGGLHDLISMINTKFSTSIFSRLELAEASFTIGCLMVAANNGDFCILSASYLLPFSTSCRKNVENL